MHREVNLTKRIKNARGLRYCPAVLSANGRVKPDAVIVQGREERHPGGSYYIEWREKGRRIRLSVGKDAARANGRRLSKEAELNAINHGVAVAPTPSKNGRRLLSVAIAEWLTESN